MTTHTTLLRVILPVSKDRLAYLPVERLGPAVGHGCKHLGIELTECIQITPEAGEDDRQFLRTHGENTRWIRFTFHVPDKTLQWYERAKKNKPELEPFDHLIAEFVADVTDRLAGALMMQGRVYV